jgi:hypothetical protein
MTWIWSLETSTSPSASLCKSLFIRQPLTYPYTYKKFDSFPLFSAIGSGISAIAKAVAQRKAKKAAEKQARVASGGAPATPRGGAKGKKGGKKGKREFLDEDDEELFQRAEDVVEFVARYLEDEMEDFERRDWAESESLEALD